MSRYQFEVKYRSPPVMNAQEGKTVVTETIFCDAVTYPHDRVNGGVDKKNYMGPVEFIEYEVEGGEAADSESRREVLKLSVRWENFISAKKVTN